MEVDDPQPSQMNFVPLEDAHGEFYADHLGSAEQCQAVVDAYNADVSSDDEIRPANTEDSDFIGQSTPDAPVAQLSQSREQQYLAQIHDLRKSLNAARTQLLRYKGLLAESNAMGNIN